LFVEAACTGTIGGNAGNTGNKIPSGVFAAHKPEVLSASDVAVIGFFAVSSSRSTQEE
jgi:hypothetical protein